MDPPWALFQAGSPVAKAARSPDLLPEIIPRVATGLEGLGLPRTHVLPTGHPRELKGCRCPVSGLACVETRPVSEAPAQVVLRVLGPGDEHLPSPTASLSFCLIPPCPHGEVAWSRARTLRLAGDPGATSHPSSPAPYRLPLFSRPQLPPPSKGALALCLNCWGVT